MCGWCKKVEVDGRWFEAEAAVNLLGLFELPLMPRLSHGICPECYRKMNKLIEADR